MAKEQTILLLCVSSKNRNSKSNAIDLITVGTVTASANAVFRSMITTQLF